MSRNRNLRAALRRRVGARALGSSVTIGEETSCVPDSTAPSSHWLCTTLLNTASLPGATVALVVAPKPLGSRAELSFSAPKGRRTVTRRGPDARAVPAVAFQAYRRSAEILAEVDPGCQISWTLLAAIGPVESDHGRYAGATPVSDRNEPLGSDVARLETGLPLKTSKAKRSISAAHARIQGLAARRVLGSAPNDAVHPGRGSDDSTDRERRTPDADRAHHAPSASGPGADQPDETAPPKGRPVIPPRPPSSNPSPDPEPTPDPDSEPEPTPTRDPRLIPSPSTPSSRSSIPTHWRPARRASAVTATCSPSVTRTSSPRLPPRTSTGTRRSRATTPSCPACWVPRSRSWSTRSPSAGWSSRSR